MADHTKPVPPGCRLLRIYRYQHTRIEDADTAHSEEQVMPFREVEYTPGGALLSETEFDEGEIIDRMVYVRGENDRLLEFSQYAGDELLTRTVCEYDEKGNRVREVRHYAAGGEGITLYEYNDQGKVICKTIIEDEDEPELKEELEYHEKFGDEIVARREWQGKQLRIEVKHTIEDKDGEPEVIETTYTHIDLPGTRRIAYHDPKTNDDHLYAVNYDHEDRIFEIHRIYYDEKGRKEKEAVKNGETGNITETLYEYDENDRVSKETIIVNGELRQFTSTRYDEKGRVSLLSLNQYGFYTDKMEYID